MMFTSEADFERADWPLLQNGAVNLFWKPEILADARGELAGLDYEISEVSCGAEVPSFEVQLSNALKWQEQFGYEPWTGNLDALNDGLRYYPFGPSGRSALVLTGFHHLVAADSERAHVILDIIETAARDHLLNAKLLIALVQTDDPGYSCPDIGGRNASWNGREWLNANRGL
ncbi:barstar family protein [Brevundimonas sp. Root1279]|uniref:barstar family protein n=1 Tax=Brevundimonas sp. Root1279 TaxID=1736443 RepID=UPI00138EDFC5|nr:barstar family protein [Brevundimonas sp. Root1279]